MKFGFIAKHRNVWPVAWLCEAMGVSRSGFHAWLDRSPSARSRSDEAVGLKVKASFLASDRTYGARRVWRDLLADGVECGLHRYRTRNEAKADVFDYNERFYNRASEHPSVYVVEEKRLC
ncbi:hypothetical protein IVB27_35655 [Bradyrhizobium sp. 197]|nr:hypothetical protein [Bradyrhizobium sp. 197]